MTTLRALIVSVVLWYYRAAAALRGMFVGDCIPCWRVPAIIIEYNWINISISWDPSTAQWKSPACGPCVFPFILYGDTNDCEIPALHWLNHWWDKTQVRFIKCWRWGFIWNCCVLHTQVSVGLYKRTPHPCPCGNNNREGCTPGKRRKSTITGINIPAGGIPNLIRHKPVNGIDNADVAALRMLVSSQHSANDGRWNSTPKGYYRLLHIRGKWWGWRWH